MSDDLMFSRARHSHPDGKLTQRVDVPMSESLHDHLVALSHVEGFSGKAEYIRSVLEAHVYGKLEVLRRLANRGPDGHGGTST